MPPRYVYWTILAGGLPTAFRATDRDDLLPTFNRLRERHPDAELKYFARGRLWNSREESQEARNAVIKDQPRRGREWRPGGEHRDPRQRFDDERKAKNQARRQERWDQKHRDTPPRRPPFAGSGDRPVGEKAVKPGARPLPSGDRPATLKRPFQPRDAQDRDRGPRPRESRQTWRPEGDRRPPSRGDDRPASRSNGPKGPARPLPSGDRPASPKRPFQPRETRDRDRTPRPKDPRSSWRPEGGPRSPQARSDDRPPRGPQGPKGPQGRPDRDRPWNPKESTRPPQERNDNRPPQRFPRPAGGPGGSRPGGKPAGRPPGKPYGKPHGKPPGRGRGGR